MREYTSQRRPPASAGGSARHQFPIEEEEEPLSSPFRPDARDENEEEPIESYRLREVQPMSPGLDKRLAFEDPASSPFRADLRDETVDFDKLREMQGSTSPGLDEQEEQNMSSPFRPEVLEETVDFEKMREAKRESFGKRQSVGGMAQAAPVESGSSQFRPNSKDDTISSHVSRGFQRESIGGPSAQCSHGARNSPFRHERDDTANSRRSHGMQRESLEKRMSIERVMQSAPVEAGGSPFRRASDANDDTVSSHVSRAMQRDSFGKSSQSPISSRNTSFRRDERDDTISSQKLRSAPRSSLGVDGYRSTATPRKRSFDQTPQYHEADSQNNERCKKGMMSRVEAPEIHVDLEEESSVIHGQSFVSAASATYDRSTIANSMMEDKRNEGMSTVLHDEEDNGKENVRLEPADRHSMLDEDDHDPMDDTGFSNFSVLPDMTSFAKLRAESPLKSMRGSVGPGFGPSADIYRRSVGPSTPGTARRSYRASALFDTGSQMGSPTPRRRESRDVGNPGESSNLLDFTDQMNFFPRQSMQGARYSPSRRSPMHAMRQSIRSPSKMSSLLDFDIPQAPTPRSLPSITPRELESLKSGFMSEISSLKATLSGKEAEVASLKQAVADAERRVGEALEEVRNEAARKDELEMEQAEWDRRGKEMETVLRSVRDELEDGERERDRLTRKVEEVEKAKEQLEGRIVELETQLAAARSSAASVSQSSSTAGSRQASQSSEATAREVQEAVEKVARELHALYKSKHETKVAALKKSYEARWEKRLREVERKLATTTQDNERLRVERDEAQSESMAAANASMIARENDEHEAEKRVFEAQIKGLQHEMAALKEDSEHLRSELKSERAEKGELVAAVDEWLAMQQGQPAQVLQPQPHEREHEREPERELSVSSAGAHEGEYQSAGEPVENFNRSIGRSGSVPGGIRAPAANEKRIPRFGAPGGHSRGNSGGKSGIAVFTPGRGGIMSSIERMGRGGA
jgi:cell division septum initiation protein DivIVA